MLYLPDQPAVVRAVAWRSAVERAASAIDSFRHVLVTMANEIAAMVRRVAEWIAPLMPMLRARRYGWTGPTLTGRELAHWRRHAGRR